MNDVKLSGKLVTAEQLLEALFTPEARPTMRWLRKQKQAGVIPFVLMGRLVFYDVELVRTALANKHLVRGKFLELRQP